MQNNLRSRDLFQLIDRKTFDTLVLKWGMDKWVRGFKTWELTCALMTVMITRLGSYREVELALGIARSTFSDALRGRSCGFFDELCDHTLFSIRNLTGDRRIKRAIGQILAIDSTEVRVHGSLFKVPGWKVSSRNGSHVAAAKLHVVYDVNGGWVDDYRITAWRRNDSPIGFQFKLFPNKIYVFDRGYNNLNFWLKITTFKSHFVTRLKNLSVTMLKEGKMAELKDPLKDGVIYDGIYIPHPYSLKNAGVSPQLQAKARFRYIVYRDSQTKKVLHLVTSDFKSAAHSIADIYRQRWAVELLFRWLKGHLDLRYLASKNTNAVRIQLVMAVMIQLLLQLKKIKIRFKGSLWDLLRHIRTTLVGQSLLWSHPPDGCRWKHAAHASYTKSPS